MILAVLRDYNFFFFNDTATTEIYSLSLHDALPISPLAGSGPVCGFEWSGREFSLPRSMAVSKLGDRGRENSRPEDRKSTRLNSSHLVISYAAFCLKKKKTVRINKTIRPWYTELHTY